MIVISYRRRYDFTRYYTKWRVFFGVDGDDKVRAERKRNKMDTERVRGYEAITGGTML